MRESDHNQDQTAQIRAAIFQMLEDIQKEDSLARIYAVVENFYLKG